MSSTFGRMFRITTFGESHGKGVGVVIDGCPAGIDLAESDIQTQLDRRRPGQSDITTARDEKDRVSILSGVAAGHTLGTPLTLMVANKDQRPADYSALRTIPRPSHADYTTCIKYGTRPVSGGGRASARETIGRVAAGAVAQKILMGLCGVDIVAWVSSIGDVVSEGIDARTLSRDQVDQTVVRCPDLESAKRMEREIRTVKEAGDSIGGMISCVCRRVPPGLGEPVFHKMEALLAQAMLSIPATKAFEIGSGFSGAGMLGSEHNDLFVRKDGRLGTQTNFSGGVQGGISNGEPVRFRVAFKTPATIGRPQATVDFNGRPVILEAKGRHDPCVVPRAVPIVESMAAIVIADLLMQQHMRYAFEKHTRGDA